MAARCATGCSRPFASTRLDRLAEAGERDSVRDRHRDFFLALAEEAAPYLEGEDHDEWLERLDPESANFLAAIEHAAAARPRIALRLCAALFLWWRARRLWAEAEAASARALAAADGEPPGPIASVLWTRAFFAVGTGQLEASRTYGTEALALAREAGDDGITARALCALGLGEMYAKPAAGRASLSRAVDHARAAGDDFALIEASDFVAFSYLFQDEHAEITRVLDEVAAAGLPRTGTGQAARHCVDTRQRRPARRPLARGARDARCRLGRRMMPRTSR